MKKTKWTDKEILLGNIYRKQKMQSQSLYDIGILYRLRISKWSFRANNSQNEFDVDQEFVATRAISSWGKKLLLPKSRSDLFVNNEQQARNVLRKYGYPFEVADAYFIPWDNVEKVDAELKVLQEKFHSLVDELIKDFPKLKEDWILNHHEVPIDAYPSESELRSRFRFKLHAYKIQGGDKAIPTNIDEALSENQAYNLVRANVQTEMTGAIDEFVNDYIDNFRGEVKKFCEYVAEYKGALHGKSVNAIIDKIDRFKNMNVFGDDEIAVKLGSLKEQLNDAKGLNLKHDTSASVATAIAQSCKALNDEVTDIVKKAEITKKIRRRIILD
jgi:hypothetical protein